MPGAGGPPLPFLPPGLGGDAGAGGGTVDGPISQLLESNFGILNQFRSNMEGFRVAENTQLLVQFRENILGIISHMEAMGGVMSQMPQLPVRCGALRGAARSTRGPLAGCSESPALAEGPLLQLLERRLLGVCSPCYSTPRPQLLHAGSMWT